MRILIVEDDENKRQQLLAFLRGAPSAIEVEIARSFQSGLRAIVGGGIDLVLLDMTLPTFDIAPGEQGGPTQAYAGREILDEMDHRGVRTPVIVVTQFDTFGTGSERLTWRQLDAQLRTDHPQTYRGVVYYNGAVAGWKKRLIDLIESVANPRSGNTI